MAVSVSGWSAPSFFLLVSLPVILGIRPCIKSVLAHNAPALAAVSTVNEDCLVNFNVKMSKDHGVTLILHEEYRRSKR